MVHNNMDKLFITVYGKYFPSDYKSLNLIYNHSCIVMKYFSLDSLLLVIIIMVNKVLLLLS